jgi:hypothetical protein
VPNSNDDGADDDDDYSYSEDEVNYSREQKFTQNIAENKDTAMKPDATAWSVGITNPAKITKTYNNDNIKGWAAMLYHIFLL